MSMAALLQVSNLVTELSISGTPIRAVDDVSFEVAAGETLGIVGESGSGKSLTMMSIMRLLPRGLARTSGQVLFRGQDLLRLGDREMRGVRGAQIGMIFQDPMSSLNPLMSVGAQLYEALWLHQPTLGRKAAQAQAIELLERVSIASPDRVLREYPHRLSGGMCQRILLAIAVCGRPRLLIADEPTTALDTTTQVQLLELIRTLQREMGMGIIWITHDLGVVAALADRVLVMYAGRVLECADVHGFFSAPSHPYSRALLQCIPRLDAPRVARLTPIEGSPPAMTQPRAGCLFASRCGLRQVRCDSDRPPLVRTGDGRARACWAQEMM